MDDDAGTQTDARYEGSSCRPWLGPSVFKQTASTAMKLRHATPADVLLLRAWDEKPHVIAATGKDDAIDWEAELALPRDWSETLIGESAGRPIGVLQIIDPAREEMHYWGDVEAGLRAID